MTANDAYGVCQLQPVSQTRETAQHTLGQDPVYEVIRETENDVNMQSVSGIYN